MNSDVVEFIKQQQLISKKKIDYYNRCINDGLDHDIFENRIKREKRIVESDFTKYNFSTIDDVKRVIENIRKFDNSDSVVISKLSMDSLESKISLLSQQDRELINEYSKKLSYEQLEKMINKMLICKTASNQIVVDNQNIEKNNEISKFIDNFISSTSSQDEINAFFMDKNNFDYIILHPEIYTDGGDRLIKHICKYFIIRGRLKILLEDNDEISSLIFDAFRSFFRVREDNNYSIPIYGYITNTVRNILLRRLDKGYRCYNCNSVYTIKDINKRSLITCNVCGKQFAHVFVKCMNNECNKLIPITSIDKSSIDKNNIRDILALKGMLKYLNLDGFKSILFELGIQLNDVIAPLKIKLSSDLEQDYLKSLIGDQLQISNVPQELYNITLVCEKTLNNSGCGSKFCLVDGLKKQDDNGNITYVTHDPKSCFFKNNNLKQYEAIENFIYDKNVKKDTSSVNIIPFDKIFSYIDDIISDEKYKEKKNNSLLELYNSMYLYFKNDYYSQLDKLIYDLKLKIGTIPQSLLNEIDRAKNIEILKTDSELANDLFYKNNTHKIGWIPTILFKEDIKQIYIDIVGQEHGHIRKIKNIILPAKFYTYFYSNKNNNIRHRKRLGVVIDKNVLCATKLSAAGYGQNFKTDPRNVSVLINNQQLDDVSAYVKNVAYWSPKNAAIDGFDSRTGIIWFDGEPIAEESWKFPNNVVINNNDTVKVSLVCTNEGYSKMVLRADFNGKIKEIFDDLIKNGIS